MRPLVIFAVAALPAIGGPADPVRRQRLEEVSRGDPSADVSRRHWFWTFEQAVEHYGPPDRMYSPQPGQINFVYEIADYERTLVFHDGRLISVE